MIDNFPAAYTELAFGVLAILMCSTIWVLIRVGAWLLSVYPRRAVAEVFDESGGGHEADPGLCEDNEAYVVDFVVWGAQCADLEDLAAELDGAQ